MSEVRIIIREADQDWSGTVHGSTADVAIAALSADPVTLTELERAMGRFEQVGEDRRPLGMLRSGANDEPYDAGLVVIDLIGRLVVVDSTYSSPGSRGQVRYHDGRQLTEHVLDYHLSDDWLFLSSAESWAGTSESRRLKRRGELEFDFRAVLFGPPLFEFLARRVFEALAHTPRSESLRLTESQPDEYADHQPLNGVFRHIHADWLLTPRDDLHGKTPREVALRDSSHLSWDMQDRCNQWSFLQECPPPLATTSHAYRFGGFGSHEWLKYYDLVREMLADCHVQLTERAPLPEPFLVGDYLATEVPRLLNSLEAWLDFPDPECHYRRPRAIMERERTRLPEGMSGKDAMVDVDCPCCQMLADLPGPMFWHLDGCNNDDEFAFDHHCDTVADWDAKQAEYAEMDRIFEARRVERERMGIDYSDRQDANSVWSRSFSVSEDENVPLGVRVFEIGVNLAEVVCTLRGEADRDSTPPATQRLIEQLNHDFANLRAVLNTDDLAEAESLLEPVIERFQETIATAADAEIEGREGLRLQRTCDELVLNLQSLLAPSKIYRPGEYEDDLPF